MKTHSEPYFYLLRIRKIYVTESNLSEKTSIRGKNGLQKTLVFGISSVEIILLENTTDRYTSSGYHPILYEVKELESGRHGFSEGWKVADIYFL